MATTVLPAAAFAHGGTASADRDDASMRARVDALLARMTLEEKIGQMTQLNVGVVAAGSAEQRPGRVTLDLAKLREALVTRHVGSIINVLDAALPAEGWHALVAQIQDVAMNETRLGVPVLYGIDFVHGANYTQNGTIFPHNVAMGATFDVALARRAGEITGAEALASALPWNFAPVLDVGRQPLWPRFYETFGEDPLVAARLGSAFLAGSQAAGVAGTMKHYLGYGAPRTGRDRTPPALTEREVREVILPPFRAAVAAGARTVMVNSGEIDGVPVHASRRWLTDVLRGELGFDGVIVTDWEDIIFLHTRHRVAATMKDAVRIALDAGVDMSMTPHDYGFADELLALVREGTMSERRVDESVRRILMLKAEVGLLDQPYPDASLAAQIGTPASRAVARQAARDAVTLLKNDAATAGGAPVLPLATGARVLVTGPAAHSLTALNGGWTYTWQGTEGWRFPEGVPSLLEAIRTHSPNVRHVGNSDARAAFADPTDAEIAAAVAAAQEVDVAIVALGETGYAEWIGDIGDLTLSRAQLRLAESVQATGVPTVLVLLEGRPRLVREVVPGAAAVVMGYWPGMEGAAAIAEVLFGAANPSGRLPFTYPKWPNAITTYDHKFTETLDTGFLREAGGFDPEFEFGHGLSYTTFSYGDLVVDHDAVAQDALLRGGRVTITVAVTNTGARAGKESVLLFTRQQYAAITPPVRRLRGFEKIELAPGASRTVRFTLGGDDLSYVGHDGRPVLELGAFDVMVGGLTHTFQVT
ncbi:MAG TPA: glycoside hydrolase family 3 N-terminal domain-containing protein [Gemmatirosa sp.]